MAAGRCKNSREKEKTMRWAFYLRELGRPVPLVLLGLAVLGWIVVARLAWVHSESEHDFRRQVRLLTAAETTARTELEQLRQASGPLASSQGRITAAQSTLTQLEQSRSAASARLAEVEQALMARRREAADIGVMTDASAKQLADVQGQLQQTTERLNAARADVATTDQAIPVRTQELAEV